jgi:lysophospholipase L1-like esterase
MTRSFFLAASVLSLFIFSGACHRRDAPGKTQLPGEKSEMSEPAVTIFKPGPIHYLALGDSTGVGVGAKNGGYVARLFKRIAARRPGSRLTNLCVSGATTTEVLNNQLKAGVDPDVDLITLGIGINDIGHGSTVEEFGQNYEAILSRLKSKTGAAIVVTNIPDISTAPQIPAFARRRYHQLIVDFNQRLESIAARHQVTLFDVYTITHQELPKHPEYFSADGFHPSDEGYELWAEQMWPALARFFPANGQE